jgi:hypothetical protein
VGGAHDGVYCEAEFMLRYHPDGYDHRRWHVERPLY